jgi:hypothetical protein
MKRTFNATAASLPVGQRGQSMVEYLVICAALAAALFAPVPNSNPPQAVGAYLTTKIYQTYQNLTFFFSLP